MDGKAFLQGFLFGLLCVAAGVFGFWAGYGR